MNDDQKELMYWIQERMRLDGGKEQENFYHVMIADPYLVSDLFQTFDADVLHARIDYERSKHMKIGVWITKIGENKPIYAEITSSKEGLKCHFPN